MIAQHSRVHVMSWPKHFPTAGDPLRDRVKIDSQAFAQMSKAYVISACGTVDNATIERLELSAAEEQLIRDPKFCGSFERLSSSVVCSISAFSAATSPRSDSSPRLPGQPSSICSVSSVGRT